MKNDLNIKNINLDKSNKMMLFTMNVVIISSLIFPILMYLYINFGAENYVRVDNYYKIETTLNKEKGKRFVPSLTPITNLETTKEWLQESVIELMTYDAANYNSEERFNKIKTILSSNVLNSYWNQDVERIESDISKGYLRSSAITSYKPILLGEAPSGDGKKMWKFYLEAQVKLESQFVSYPTYITKRMQVVIKEVDPADSFNGIGIIKIDIK